MIKFSVKKLVTAMALSLSIAIAIPSALPLTNVNGVVTVDAASAKLNKKSATLLAGQTLKLSVSNKGKKSIKWSTSNTKVATVKNGTVTATGKGNATITAIVGNKKLKCKLTVKSNTYSLNTKIFSGYLELGSVYFIPSSVYYKNGKLYCKTSVLNYTGSTIKFFGDRRGNTPNKIKTTLKSYKFASLLNPKESTVILAKGDVKANFPTNIKNKKTKTFTVEFSGSQIKKKGYDLSTIDLLDIEFGTKLYYFE